jgi:neutral amino acid transport system permease protein
MFSPDYLVYLVTVMAIYALFSLGLNLQWGFTGLLNFGHAGFMAIAAYGAVLLYQTEGVPNVIGLPMPIAVVLGALGASLLGLVMGFSTLRLREDYLAIVTIGLSELIRLFANNESKITGGSQGIQGLAVPLAEFRPNVFTRWGMVALLTAVVGYAAYGVGRYLWQAFRRSQGTAAALRLLTMAGSGLFALYAYGICVKALLDFNLNPAQKAPTGLMFISILMLAIVYWALETLVRSPWGRVLKSIREDEEVPKALGKNIFFYKLQALMIGGFIAGLGAILNAWQLSNVYPDVYQTGITFTAWTIVVLGGAGSNPGTILGAIVYWIYNATTRDLDKVLPFLQAGQIGALRVMLIGLILMLLMVWRPQGIMGNKDELTLGR